ncbi:hypothetical protein T06_3203, partial [Trichinella sp. T6]
LLKTMPSKLSWNLPTSSKRLFKKANIYWCTVLGFAFYCIVINLPVKRPSFQTDHTFEFPQVHVVKKHFNQSESKQLPKTGLLCIIPQLQLDNPEMKHFFKPVKSPFKCAKESNWIIVKDGNYFIINENSTRTHGNITCNYMPFWRVSDKKISFGKKIHNFTNGSRLLSDFFLIKCFAEDSATYENIHSAVVPTTEALNRKDKLHDEALGLNVYILGFDSISRMTFMRKMKNMYGYLRNTLKAVILEQYNIVGDGTPQALIPMLTGKTEQELPNTRKRYRKASYVNIYPFIWNEYKNAGYVTLYGEDAAYIGTFTYRLKGFDQQPTDHYMRTFYQVAESSLNKNPKFCCGSEPHHRVHFKYVEDFFTAYPVSKKKFAFQFHSAYSHDDINLIEVADLDMVKHLKFLQDGGFLNNTLLIVMSDHGNRFHQIRETQQGKLEERMPFFSVVLPPWFSKKYPEAMNNLQKNARRLTTPFDIHETLLSVLHFQNPKMGNVENRSISLFDEVPEERVCQQAGIEPHWCACHISIEQPNNSKFAQYIAEAIVSAINNYTEPERQICVKLKLKSLEKLMMYVPDNRVMGYKMALDYDGFVPDLSAKTPTTTLHYTATLRTVPGNGLYEATVRWEKLNNQLWIDLDSISHINAFGSQPQCIIDKDYFMAKWCVCYDQL